MKTLLVDSPRVESGALQFQHFNYNASVFDDGPKDWPGVFVRGCEAKALANELGGLLSKAADNNSPLSYALIKKFLVYVYEADLDNQPAQKEPAYEPEPIQPIAQGYHGECGDARGRIEYPKPTNVRSDLQQIERDFQTNPKDTGLY